MRLDRGTWSIVCLTLLAVLAPTACILYFMNEALSSQQVVARQKLAEAYRGQLRSLQQKLDGVWQKRAIELDSLTGSPSAVFEKAVTAHLADAIIYLDAAGRPAYPSRLEPPSPDPRAGRADWEIALGLERKGRFQEAAVAFQHLADQDRDDGEAARALQAQIRCTARFDRALAASLAERFQAGRYASAHDLQGRWIAADELLFSLKLHSAADRAEPDHILLRRLRKRLHDWLANYQTAIPSGQRLFLMEELRSVAADPQSAAFPTYSAEQLAAKFLEVGRIQTGDTALRMSENSDVWRITSPNRRVIALYRDSTVQASIELSQAVESLSPHGPMTLGVNSPGTGGVHDLTLDVGPHMPGWQVVLDLRDNEESAGVAARRRTAYIWFGVLVIATLIGTAALASGAFLRQMRLARMKTDLVATVSHELKTPLAGMQLLVDSLLESPESDPVRTRQYLELIARENGRLSRLISNFLTFSRMERNRAQFEFARTEPESVVRAAVESIGDRFAVDVSIAPDLPAVLADEDALVTVVLNLLDNAYKYSAEPRNIRLIAYAEAGRCCFAVEDNGVGIAAREQKKIFRRFYQVNRKLTGHAGGVGLGLSIVQFIVKAHSGTIAVESRPGEGSRFVVSLPSFSEAKGAAV